MLPQPCCCPQMALPHHTLFVLQDWPQLKSLDLSWASSEPVIFGDTLMRLTQLKDLTLGLLDFSGLVQLPPSVTFLKLHTWELFDVAAAPCLQCCPSLQSLFIKGDKGVHYYALAKGV